MPQPNATSAPRPSDTDDLTPREVRLCREAVERTVNEIWPHVRRAIGSFAWEGSEPLAARLYPMPTVEVPRVVDEPGFATSYKIDTRPDGRRVLFVRSASFTGGEWREVTYAPHTLDIDRIALIVDLYANPTHRVPADEVTDA
jgi:hypothetical protein